MMQLDDDATAMLFKCTHQIKFSGCFICVIRKIECKGKVIPVLLTENHAMKAYSLTSALDGNEWSDSRPGRFTPRERAPGTHWI